MKFLIILLILQFNYAFSQKEYLHQNNVQMVEFDYNNKDLQFTTKSLNTLYEIYRNCDINGNFVFQTGFTGTICDKNGDLLLYTDGRHLFDKNNNLIYLNNKYFNIELYKTEIEKQKAVLKDSAGAIFSQILKVPGCNESYYVLYTATTYAIDTIYPTNTDTLVRRVNTGGYNLYCYKFNYSPNTGFKLLESPFKLADSIIPNLAITKSSNNIDLWITTRKFTESKFLSFSLSDFGISETPIISKFSNKIKYKLNDPTYDISTQELIGGYTFLFSPNSKYLIAEDGYNYAFEDNDNGVMFYNFDSHSGKLTFSNIIRQRDSIFKIWNFSRTFINFSPNSNYLYFFDSYNINIQNLAINRLSLEDIVNGNFNYSTINYYKKIDNYFFGNRINNFYNKITFLSSVEGFEIPNNNNINISDLYNADSSLSKLRLSFDINKSKLMNDKSNEYGYLFRGNNNQIPVPGGFYGTDVYKEKCPKDSIKLAIQFELNEKDSLYEWTGPNGFTSKQRNPILYNLGKTNQGWYDLKVYDPKIDCFRNFALHLEVKDSAEVEFIQSSGYRKDRITYLKTNDSLTLYIPENNFDKVWSTGETGDKITVTKTGRYTLKLNTNRWCENVKYIDVVEDSMVVIEAEDVEFYQHKISDSNPKIKDCRINCKSYAYDLKVYDYVNSNPEVFETNLPILNSQTVIQFKPGGYYEFEVNFKPKEKRKYFDSIVFFSNARIIDNVTYLYGEGVDSIASVEDEHKVITEITQSTHIELYDILGRSIATFPNYDKLKAEIENYPPPHLIKWRDEKGIFHYEKMK